MEVTERADLALLAAALAAAMLVCGLLEGPDVEAHARWMGETEARGTAVAW